MGIHIVSPFFNQSPSLDPFNQFFNIFNLQNNDPLNRDVLFKQVCLPERAGYPVEEKELLRGEVAVCGYQAMDEVVPDLDRHFVGQKQSLPCIVVIELAGRGFRG